MTPAKFLAAISGRSLHPSDVPGGGKPEWTVAEAGIALSGLEDKHVAAIIYKWVGGSVERKILKAALKEEALLLQKKEKWPKIRKGRNYLISLVNLALFEEDKAQRWFFFCEMLLDDETTKEDVSLLLKNRFWSVAMGVTKKEWDKFYSKKYEGIHSFIDLWASVAHEHMRDKI